MRVSKNASQSIGTTANLRKGDVFSLHDLFYGCLLPSGNDASVCIAETVGLMLFQEECVNKQIIDQYRYQKVVVCKKWKEPYKNSELCAKFISEMNFQAKSLWMLRTHYANPSGLTNKNNYSTAQDICILCCNALNDAFFHKVVSCKSFRSTFKNTSGEQR